MVFAPVDIGPAGTASTVEDVGWLDSNQLSFDGLSVLHAYGRQVDLLALLLQETFEMASNPAPASPDEIAGWSEVRNPIDTVDTVNTVRGTIGIAVGGIVHSHGDDSLVRVQLIIQAEVSRNTAGRQTVIVGKV